MITESDFTIMAVGITAIDSIASVVIRACAREFSFSRTTTFSAFTMVPFTIAIVLTPASWYGFVLVTACVLTHFYNLYYIMSTDDQLCEGLIWPKFRDYLMAKMQKVEDDADTMEAHSTHADRMDY